MAKTSIHPFNSLALPANWVILSVVSQACNNGPPARRRMQKITVEHLGVSPEQLPPAPHVDPRELAVHGETQKAQSFQKMYEGLVTKTADNVFWLGD
jgi:hypothetical protein